MDYEKYRRELKQIIDDNPESFLSDGELLRFSKYLEDMWWIDDLKLYRYSPADYFNIRNFESGKLRLTNNGVLNDVYEGIPFDDCKEITPLMASGLSELAYIKSFTEDPYNTLMWSHYADNQRGICIEYDLQLMPYDDPLWEHLFPVVYSSERRIKMDITEMAKELKQLQRNIEDYSERDDRGYLDDCKSLFISKGKAWSYEKEWRIVYTKAEIYDINDKELNQYIISLEFSTAIYLGFRIDPTVKENILEIVSRINRKRIEKYPFSIQPTVPIPPIKVYQIMLEDNSYELSAKEINFTITDDGSIEICN